MALPAQTFDKKNLGKASEPPHVKILWLGVNNGMLPAQTFDKKNLGKASEPPHVKILWLGVNNGASCTNI